jgi:uncharacterized small protein (DUF1192 family)
MQRIETAEILPGDEKIPAELTVADVKEISHAINTLMDHINRLKCDVVVVERRLDEMEEQHE